MNFATDSPITPQRWMALQPAQGRRAKSVAQTWGPVFAIAAALIWSGAVVYGFRNALVMFAAIGVMGTLVGFVRPTIGLFAVGIMSVLDGPMRACLATGGFFRENTYNYLMLLMILCFGFKLLKRKDPHTWLLACLVGLLGVELLVSPSMMRGITHLLNGIAAFGILLVFMRGAKDDDTWYWLAVINGITAAMAGLFYYLQKDSLPYIDRNGLAYLPLTGMFSICFGFRAASRHRGGVAILGTLAAVCACWVFLTTSRGGMLIGLVCASCLLMEVRGMSGRFVVIGLGAIIAIGVIAQFAEQRDKSLARAAKLADSERSLVSRTSGRSDLVRGAWQIFAKNPLGVGTGGYASSYAELSKNEGEFTFGAGHEASAHSAWLKTLAENGIPGIILLTMYVYSFAFVAWKKRRRGLFFLGILPTVTLTVGFMTSEFQGKGMWFLAAGATVILHSAAFATPPASGKRSLRRSSERYFNPALVSSPNNFDTNAHG